MCAFLQIEGIGVWEEEGHLSFVYRAVIFFFSLVDRLQAIWVHTFSCPASALYHSIDPACTW